MYIKRYLLHTVLILTALGMLLPFLVMVIISLSADNSLLLNNFALTTQNYLNVFNAIPITRYFINSLIVAILTTIGQVFISTLAGYAFARIKF